MQRCSLISEDSFSEISTKKYKNLFSSNPLLDDKEEVKEGDDLLFFGKIGKKE